MTRSLRAVLLEDLEITTAAQLLEDDDSDAEDSDEGLFRDAIASYRYLTRSTVFKAAHWTPGRIFRSDPMRARRDLHMSRGTFIYLLGRIQHDVVFARAPTKQEQAPVQLQLEVFLFALQSLSTHRVAQHFGIAEGSVYNFKDRVTCAILALEKEFVRWPSKVERNRIAQAFEARSAFPVCVGCVDGTAFKLLNAPAVNPECYFSRKSVYCIGAQIICDHRHRITYYQIGQPGSLHDKRAMSLTAMSDAPGKFF
ncbi:hypothetical protein PF010_g12072 [Phytophthora fragariae]|uniref:DDE Tnp4 domain-containing protein n=1 Tax=Phytophthora fragariae TaxID=53985 RepID=A0A6G0L438_9STRA|nr:hypothetical protein PF010_g12072 [Phytophthora fragariae]KAE9359786.1 hypothetical protein PF008_g2110 [Phytophthora fragariae]